VLAPKSSGVVQEAERFLARRGWRNCLAACMAREATVSTLSMSCRGH
jgi:hypothetical protein